MRPAILVIIMDFLVSSLLLFISGPDPWQVVPEGGGLAPAPAFSAAALREMETRWAREAQAARIRRTLDDQNRVIARLSRRSADLESAKSGLESELADRRRELELRQADLARQAREAERLQQAQAELTSAIGERERQIAAQREQLAARQAELTEKAREAERLQQERAALAAAIHEREQLVASQQASIARLTDSARELEILRRQQADAQRSLRDIQADQTQMAQNLTALREAETQTHGRLADLAEQQAGVAARLGELQGAQGRMETTLESVRALAAGLPEVLRAGLEDLASAQQRLDDSLDGLGGSLADLRAVSTASESGAVAERLAALAAQHRALQEALQAAITGQTDTLTARLADARRSQDTLQSDMKALAARVEDIGAKRPGPFRPFRDARIELRVSLTERFRGSDIAGYQFINYSATLYPPLLASGSNLWIAAGYKDLGLAWPGITSDLRHPVYRVVARERGGSAVCRGALQALADDPRVILMGFSATNDPYLRAAGLDRVMPMPILGRAALEARGVAGLHLFKRSSEGLNFALEASFDMNDPRSLVVRRTARGWVSALQRAFTNPNARPEAGDFVVTAEGAFVGLMVDSERCLVFEREPGTGLAIPLDNPAAFAEAVKQFRRVLK